MIRPAELQLVDVAAELVSAARTLSRHRLGAVIVWDPSTSLDGGVILDARVSRQLLVATFSPESLNDLRVGATVIRGGRVERAAVPITWTDVIERADELAAGAALEVDEDTGQIRHVDRMGRVEIVDATSLTHVLHRRALAAGRPAR